MANVTTIIGFDKVMARLNVELDKIDGKTVKGLVLASAMIRNDMETTPPLTPVDLGNLRASFFVATPTGISRGGGNSGGRFKGPKAGVMASEHAATISEAKGMVSGNKKKPGVVLGYSANYALYVHENIGMHDASNPYWAKRKKGWRPNSGPKWFEAAFKRNSKKIVQIVADNAKII